MDVHSVSCCSVWVVESLDVNTTRSWFTIWAYHALPCRYVRLFLQRWLSHNFGISESHVITTQLCATVRIFLSVDAIRALSLCTVWMFQSLHEELLQQQESFDNLAEQAQVLMQSSTDSRVSTQLTQMNSRYSALITVSKVSFINSWKLLWEFGSLEDRNNTLGLLNDWQHKISRKKWSW